MWQVMRCFGPRTAYTKRANLKNILSCQPAKNAYELEATFMRIEGHTKQYCPGDHSTKTSQD